ncbi:hypothetical protein [Bradyrhizobium japonicum]|uniref:hypothetical protein n=1 Tax=Bradyrhizobium japonicum TaxID=375 RepID=UPI001B89E8A2|nr:hypothetical protein [Bradyrhizobium japonicum]MBR0969624.1 hypothetical protein [Bradyrhizobium japonicum]
MMPERTSTEIVTLCKQELAPSGFIGRKGTTIWRRTNLKFDVLKFDVIPRARSEKWRVPLGSFGLEPSCLFPFLPRAGHALTDGFQPEKGFGQVRLSIRDERSQRADKAPRIWCAGDDGVVQDVLDTINNNAIPFFQRFEDSGELLRTFLEDEDAIGLEGVWDFGKKGSPKRLLYTGFAAIECGRWDLAVSSLLSCKEKAIGIPEPVGRSVRAEYVPYIQEGIACAENKCAWKHGEGPTG